MDPLNISAGLSLTREAAKILLPLAFDIIETVKRHGELSPAEKARLEALNAKDEADYVREAGGRE